MSSSDRWCSQHVPEAPAHLDKTLEAIMAVEHPIPEQLLAVPVVQRRV